MSTDNLRYPIGPFEEICDPSAEQRGNWMKEIGRMPSRLRKAVEDLSEEQLAVPYRPGGWTIRQVVHHLADNDMNSYIRFKKAMTEENPAASTYRQNMWAELNDYEAPIEASLVLIEALRSRFSVLLEGMQAWDFARTFTSPTNGLMTLDTAIQRFEWHGRHHLAQINSLKKRMGW
ncbi:YfiT family bacillithiol transferase [Paenibacillus glycanilyticus]|uniref:YfiT family bacillithiol transferase n=1 Tax=Paenibacillus glycanilyticus TaxID=126569 RepID=UPI0019109211|nr:putative metal-dependent hydrolase [Paenibacillus glycanilyticus]